MQTCTDSNTSIITKNESEARGYCRHFETVFTSAEGSIMYDNRNKKYHCCPNVH